MCHFEEKRISDAVIEGYENLAKIQEKISDLEDFRGRNSFREDWRGWRFDKECLCDRCMRLKGA